MSFHAKNDSIVITDTDGSVVFDTSNDMPHILGSISTRITQNFDANYYSEWYYNIGHLPLEVNFCICRATLTRDRNPYEMVKNYQVNWAVIPSGRTVFFQGSVLLESGFTYAYDRGVMYARRAMHVYPEPSWGNAMVVMFQQTTKSGAGSTNSYSTADRYDKASGTVIKGPFQGTTYSSYIVDLTVWYGRFR